MFNYLTHQIVVMSAMLAERRRVSQRIGPGVFNTRRGKSKYTGAILRAIRRLQGVGRPVGYDGLHREHMAKFSATRAILAA